MELHDYIMKFPPSWRGVFAALSKDHQPVLRANSWLPESRADSLAFAGRGSKTMSCYENQVDWMGFCECLREKEPVELNRQLVFLPRILLFPVNIQRNAFAFLRHHSSEIPTKCLQELLDSLKDQSISDEWTLHELRTIQEWVCKKQCSNYGTGSWAGDRHSKMTKASQGLFHNVCQRIRDGDRDCDHRSERWKLQFDWLPKALLSNPRTCQHRTYFASGTSPGPDTLPTDPQEDTKETLAAPIEMQLPASNSSPKVVSITDSPPPSHMEVEQVSDETTPFEASNINNLSTLSQDLLRGQSSPPVVKLGEQGGITEIADVKEESSRQEIIDAVTMEKLISLKTATSTGETIPSDHLRVIIDCPINQMEAVCDVLELDSLPAAGLVSLVHLLADFSLELSNSSAIIIARRCFAKQVQNLTQTASRSLITAAVCLAKAFPKPAIEGALIPALTMDGGVGVCTSHQCDLVAKVAKDALTNEDRVYFVSKLLSVNTLQWSEELTGLFQTILSCKLELDMNTLESFVAALEHHGSSQNSCAKFAKLLLAVINRFSKQVSSASILSLQRMADNNRTFLKKALLAAIKRVKG